jgi:hypothetical protein
MSLFFSEDFGLEKLNLLMYSWCNYYTLCLVFFHTPWFRGHPVQEVV